MNVSAFRASLRRSWLPALLLFELCLFGSIVYARHTIQTTAEATVAVRDPLTVRPGYEAAQITFDAIVGSRRLAERVAERLELPASQVEGALSVEVQFPETSVNISPLYAVQAEMPDDEAAITMVNTAVEEGRKLFVELNEASTDQVTETLAAEQAAAVQEEQTAQAAFDSFVSANDTAELTTRLEAATESAQRLADQVAQASADLAGARTLGEPVAISVSEERLEEFERQRSVVAAERDRLRALSEQYDALEADVARTRSRAEGLDDLEHQTIVGQLLPLEAQVKVLDTARVQPQTLMKILMYAVGTLVGLLAAASAIYAGYLRNARRETAETIQVAFNAPVLARIPHNSIKKAVS